MGIRADLDQAGPTATISHPQTLPHLPTRSVARDSLGNAPGPSCQKVPAFRHRMRFT